MLEKLKENKKAIREATGVTEMTFWRWVSGTNTPHLKNLKIIAEIMEVDINDLIKIW